MDPDLFTKICDKAKKASGARKPAVEDVEDDKYASIRQDPAFLARASLRAKISGRGIKKEILASGDCEPAQPESGEVYVTTHADEVESDDGSGGNGNGGEVMVYEMTGDADEAELNEPGSGDEELQFATEERDPNAQASDSDEPGSGDEELQEERDPHASDFGGDLTELEDEEYYAHTEEGSQA